MRMKASDLNNRESEIPLGPVNRIENCLMELKMSAVNGLRFSVRGAASDSGHHACTASAHPWHENTGKGQGRCRCPRLTITFWQRLLQEEDDQQHAAGLADEANQEGVVVHREAWLIARVAVAGEVDQVDERPENLQLSRLS